MTQAFSLPFQCQCKFLGTCKFEENAKVPETKEKYKSMAKDLKDGVGPLLEMFMTPKVAANPQKQQAMANRLQNLVQSCYQYEDEMNQAIALSIIPEEI